VNRRTFLRALIAVPLAAKIPTNPLELFFDTTKLHGARVVSNLNWDENTLYYIYTSFNLWVNNPSQIAIIDGITE